MSYFREVGVGVSVVCLNSVWGEEESNLRRLRQQIYSLPHLTALVSPRNGCECGCGCEIVSRWTDSNRRPADYKSAALPTELHRPVNNMIFAELPLQLTFAIKKTALYKKDCKISNIKDNIKDFFHLSF